MISGRNGSSRSLRRFFFASRFLFCFERSRPRPPAVPRASRGSRPPRRPVRKKSSGQDDSFILTPAKDLALQPENARKADALTDFVEGTRLEENAEMEMPSPPIKKF